MCKVCYISLIKAWLLVALVPPQRAAEIKDVIDKIVWPTKTFIIRSFLQNAPSNLQLSHFPCFCLEKTLFCIDVCWYTCVKVATKWLFGELSLDF